MMSLIARKRRPLERGKVDFRDAKLIVIATEGEKTEERYLRVFRRKRCHVKVIPSEGGKSSPKYILDNLDKIRAEFGFNEDDQFWLMIDVDTWKPKELAFVVREALSRDYKLAISNPCFECWLYLHFATPKRKAYTSEEITAELRSIMGGYNKAKLDGTAFVPYVQDALRRAKELDTNPQHRWPHSTGTHVYKVVEIILSL